MEFEDFLSAQGFTEETFEEEAAGYAEDHAKVLYICQAIIDAENITITDEEGEELMADYMVQYGVDTLEALREALNGGDEVDKAIVTEKALQIVIDNATITETEAEEAPAEEAEVTPEAEAEAEEAPAEEAAAEETPAATEAAAEEAPAATEAAAEEAPAETEAAAEEAPAATEEAPAEAAEETPAE